MIQLKINVFQLKITTTMKKLAFAFAILLGVGLMSCSEKNTKTVDTTKVTTDSITDTITVDTIVSDTVK